MEKSAGLCFSMAPVFLFLGIVLLPQALADHDYGQALTNSILFFEAQRSGVLPSNQRVAWRANSGLLDGKLNGVNLVGGYYDAGDNVKFGLPMAFTVTMMSWSILEYGKQMDVGGELWHAIDAVKWGTDYFIKAHPEPYVLYGEVGDGHTDHSCWQRPEDMTTSRNAYKIDASNPGSDLAGETAAAMAAASIVFSSYKNPSYAAELLKHATQLFDFADKYRGKYDNSIRVAQNYYGSVSGYGDELLWAAVWLYKATGDEFYLNYLVNNGDALGGTGWAMTEFGWDVKYVGVQTLVAELLLSGKAGEHAPVFNRYRENAESFMCSCLGKSAHNADKTPAGLIYVQSWNNLQFVTSASFLAIVYSDYLASARQSLSCASGTVSSDELLSFAKSQVDYILGDNPRATSYMVGYGSNYPTQVHHRAASIVSYKVDHSPVACTEGYATWYSSKASNPNLLTGAIVGGPDSYDNFADDRYNYEQTEPATYNNAPLIGTLARLHAGRGGYNQLPPAVKPIATTPKMAPALTSSPVVITQRIVSSWQLNGRTYYRYRTRITNRSSKKLRNLKLNISKLYGPLWGLAESSGNSYFFPSWITYLPAGKSIDFVYIHPASPAQVWASSYNLV